MVLLVIGVSNDRFAALLSGGVHSTFLSPPLNFKAVEMGYEKLASATDYVKWPLGSLGTRDEKLLSDPEEVGKMTRASLKGLRFMHAQREYIISKLMPMFKLSRDEATKTYEMNRDDSLPSGYFSRDAEHQVLSLAKQAANIVEDILPERVFDNRFVKQAERELKDWIPHTPR